MYAASSDQAQLAVYAAEHPAGGPLTVMVINKKGESLASVLQIQNFDANQVQGYRYSPADLNAIQPLPSTHLGPGGLTATYPPNSITLWIIPSGEAVDWQSIYMPVLIHD